MKSLTFLILAFSFLLIKNVASQDTLILQPGPEGKDAIICDYYTTNIGDYPNLFAQTGFHEVPFITRSLFEFDLSSIVPGAEILEAKLSLYFANNPGNPHYQTNDNSAFLQRVITTWEEYLVTWYNQPEITTENQVLLPNSQYPDQDYTDIDIKSLIQDIINDPGNSFGLLFRLQYEEADRRMFFASSDHLNPILRPKLEIIYSDCPLPSVGFEFIVDH